MALIVGAVTKLLLNAGETLRIKFRELWQAAADNNILLVAYLTRLFC